MHTPHTKEISNQGLCFNHTLTLDLLAEIHYHVSDAITAFKRCLNRHLNSHGSEDTILVRTNRTSIDGQKIQQGCSGLNGLFPCHTPLGLRLRA